MKRHVSPTPFIVCAVAAALVSLGFAAQALRSRVVPSAVPAPALSAVSADAAHLAVRATLSPRPSSPDTGRNSVCDAPALLEDQPSWADDEARLLERCHRFAALAFATVQLAQTQAKLAQLYGRALLGGAPATLRPQLTERTQLMLASSAAVYDTVLGPMASRTQLAARRLARAHEGDVGVAARPSTALAAEASGTHVLGAAGPQPSAQEAAPDVAQLASDLARLRAQAEAVSHDPDGLRARIARAEAARARCSDDACLRRWYARRRAELLAEF